MYILTTFFDLVYIITLYTYTSKYRIFIDEK